jgi:glycosyltransferase involved in cell wall biosynthesis
MSTRSSPSIVLVTGTLAGGGAERALSDMANFWDDAGWAVTFATWSGPDTEDFFTLRPGIKRVWLQGESGTPAARTRIGAYRARLRVLRRLVAEVRPVAVLSFIDISNVMTLIACTGLRTRVVVSERVNGAKNPTIRWPWRVLRALTYWRASAIVAQTADAARWVRRTCGATARVIPNALRALPDVACDREPLVLGVGRLSFQKGFDLSICAFARLAARFPKWRLVLIGAGPERESLEALARRTGVADRVEFLAPTRDVESWMARAGLVVQPSRFEGFPNVVLEAMGMGAAVVSADCASGPAELIEDGRNGRLVPVGNVERLAEVMGELMADETVRRRLGHEARRVRERYAQASIMRQWEICLRRATNQ